MSDLLSGKTISKKVNSFLQNYVFLFCLYILLLRLFYLRYIDDLGMGYMALPMELFLVSAFGIGIPLTKVISGLVKTYIKRQQYKNALKISNIGWLIAFVFAGLLAVIVFVGAWKWSSIVQTEYAWIAVMISAVAVFFTILSSAGKGLVIGVSADLFVFVGYLLEIIAVIACSITGAVIGHGNGMKIAKLLKVEEMQYSYTAIGIIAGIALSQVIVWLYFTLMYFLSRHALSIKNAEDATRRTEDTRVCLLQILSNLLPISILSILAQSILVVLQWSYLHYMEEETLTKGISFWGCFYGKYLPFVMIPIIFAVIKANSYSKRLAIAYQNDEHRPMREAFEKCLIATNTIAFSGAVFISVLSPIFLKAFCQGMTTSVSKLLSGTSVVIICYCYFYMAHNLLQRMQYHGESILIGLIAYVIAIVIVFVVGSKMLGNLVGVGIMLCIFFALSALGAGFRVVYHLRCRIDLLKTFGWPLISACISGLIIVILNRAFFEVMNPILLFVMALLCGFLFDILVLLATRVISESQVKRLPFGFLANYIARFIGIL